MRRGWILPAAIVVIIALVLYFTLPGEKMDPKRVVDPFFNRTVKVITPPSYAVEKGPRFRIDRLLDRIEWGTSQSVNWSIECLENEPDRSFVPEVIRRIQESRIARPTKAKQYIDLLAELSVPEGLSVLIECASDPSSMVHAAAIKGVARYDDKEATECLLEHARAPRPGTKALVGDLLAHRTAPEVIAFFEEALKKGDAELLPFAMKAVGESGREGAAALLRPYLDDPNFYFRTQALRQLLALGDEEANLQLFEDLRHPGPVLRKAAIQALFYVRRLPPGELLESLAGDEDDEIRLHYAHVLVSLMDRFQGEDRERLTEVLDRLSRDRRLEVRIKAFEGLYLAGRREVADPYLRKLGTAIGGELKEAVTFLGQLDDLEGTLGARLKDRYENDDALTATDRLALLDALSVLEYSGAIDPFFDTIQGKWHAREVELSGFSLAAHAAFKVHHLEGDVMIRWLEALNEDASETMAYLFINGARSLEDPRAADALIVLAKEVSQPRWVRREALRSFPFLRDLSQGRKLLDYADQEPDPELGRLAMDLFWNFF